jgi:hypothetical protein
MIQIERFSSKKWLRGREHVPATVFAVLFYITRLVHYLTAILVHFVSAVVSRRPVIHRPKGLLLKARSTPARQ